VVPCQAVRRIRGATTIEESVLMMTRGSVKPGQRRLTWVDRLLSPRGGSGVWVEEMASRALGLLSAGQDLEPALLPPGIDDLRRMVAPCPVRATTTAFWSERYEKVVIGRVVVRFVGSGAVVLVASRGPGEVPLFCGLVRADRRGVAVEVDWLGGAREGGEEAGWAVSLAEVRARHAGTLGAPAAPVGSLRSGHGLAAVSRDIAPWQATALVLDYLDRFVDVASFGRPGAGAGGQASRAADARLEARDAAGRMLQPFARYLGEEWMGGFLDYLGRP